MEVVGVVANFIAIAQALETGAKMVDLLREIPGISSEMMSLNNEIESLRVNIETARVQAAAALKDEPEPPGLKAARLCIEQMARDMQSVVTRCTRAKGKDGKIKPNYLKWLWLQKELKGCHEKTRDAKSSLELALLTLNLKQSNQLVLRLESYVVRQTTPELPSSVHQPLLPAPQETEESQQLETEHSIQELSMGLEQVVVADRRQKSRKATKQGAKFDMIAFKAKLSMRGRCKSPCPCRCHGVPTSTFTTASWARNLVGSLFVSYDRLPLFGSSVACTEADCKGNTQTSTTTFTYQFPTWLCSRYMAVHAAMDSSIGFKLRPVRILAFDDYIWHATEKEPASLLRLIENGNPIFPDDAGLTGLTVLEYAMNWAPDEVLAFLVQLWGDELGKDSYNPKWLYEARRQLEWWPDMPADGAQALCAIISIGEEIVDTAETPLHEAARLDDDDDGNDDEVRRRVREAAAQCPWAVGRWDNRGQTPLHIAAMKGNPAAVKELVRLGCDLDQGDFRGYTALIGAARRGHTNVVRHLLDAGCSVNAADTDGRTALHFAALARQEPEGEPAEILRILLDAGATVDSRGALEETAVHNLAVSWATKDIIKAMLQVLLRAGADINALNYMGQTSLMLSVVRNRLPPLQAFTEAGASTNDSDLFGRNLLHLAAQFAGIEILEYLTTVEALVVDHEQLDIGGDSPWDSFIWTLHTPQWIVGAFRKPDPDEQDAFVVFYRCIRDRNLQFDIDALQRARQYLTEKDGRGAAAALAPLIKRKKEWKREAESDTYNAVALQVRQGMWEAALESVDENVELLLEKMEESPWDQESYWDSRGDEYATDSDEEEDEDDCVTIDDEESASDGHGDSDEEDGGSCDGYATV